MSCNWHRRKLVLILPPPPQAKGARNDAFISHRIVTGGNALFIALEDYKYRNGPVHWHAHRFKKDLQN